MERGVNWENRWKEEERVVVGTVGIRIAAEEYFI